MSKILCLNIKYELKKVMIVITQILTSLLILLSLFLIISIPISMAVRTKWEKFGSKYIRLSQLWLALVGATGIVASLSR